MERSVYLHIGLSKTGSTSIQNLLMDNRTKLLKQGVLYPDLFGEISGQNSLMAYAASVAGLKFSPFVKAAFNIKDDASARQFRTKFITKFKAICDKHVDVPITVLSCELLSQGLTLASQIKTLKGLLERHFDKIEILVYLRPQESRIKSMYSQALKMGKTIEFKEFSNRKEDYFVLLNRWVNVFGLENINARILQPDFLVGGDLITDFYTAIGGKDLESLDQPARVNESISLSVADFLRKFNAIVPTFDDNGKVSNVRGNLIPYLEKYCLGEEKLTISEQEVFNIRKTHAESNERVRSMFFPNKEQLFSSEDIVYRDDQARKVDEFIEISAFLWTEHYALLERKNKKISELEDEKRNFKVKENARKRILAPETFGREIKSDKSKLKPRERLFEMEGAFSRHPSRPNIAKGRFWSTDMTHPEDIYKAKELLDLQESNYKLWRAKKDDQIQYIEGFNPLIDVAIYDISLEVKNIPIDNYNFLLGDGCIYMGHGKYNKPRKLPAMSEAHCSAVSLFNSSGYTRSLCLPSDMPLYLSRHEKLSTPQHFTRHLPHTIAAEDMEASRVRSKIRYRPYDPSIVVHKFIRIPYLDQYPAQPNMIQKDRPWYKSWDENEPLVVRGFSVYFSPKPPIAQHLENMAIYVLDEKGKRVPGKTIKLSDQIAGGGNESLSLDPMFVRGDLIIEPGQFLSASASLIKGTKTADLAIFVLVEIPKSRVPTAYGSPLFYSQGCVNMDYLKNQYDLDRQAHFSTPAAKDVLRDLVKTNIEPWNSEFGDQSWSSDEAEQEKLYSLATRYLFID